MEKEHIQFFIVFLAAVGLAILFNSVVGNVIYYFADIDEFGVSSEDSLPVIENFSAIPNSNDFYELNWDVNYGTNISSGYRIVIERWGPMKLDEGDSFPDPWVNVVNLSINYTNFTDNSVSENDRIGVQYVYRIRIEDEGIGTFSNWSVSWAKHRKYWRGWNLSASALYLQSFDERGVARCAPGEIVDPVIVGKLGGNVLITQTNHRYVDLNNLSNNSEQLIKLKRWIEISREVARENDVPIRFFMYARADTMLDWNASSPNSNGYSLPPGFNYSWIFRMNRTQFEDSRTSSLSFNDDPSYVTEDFWDYVWRNGEYYGYFYGWRGVLVNLNDSNYRSWVIENAVRMANFLDVEGTTAPGKFGWMSYSSTSNSVGNAYGWCMNYPANEGRCTPYGPGEYEEGLGKYMMQLSDAGLEIVYGEVPDSSGVIGWWMNDTHRESILGQTINYYVPANLRRCIPSDYLEKIDTSFNASVTSGSSPLTVQFDALNITSLDLENRTVLWDFGDGSTVEGTSASHVFSSNPGDPETTYNVTMSLVEEGGVVKSNFVIVTLEANPLPPSEDSSGGGSSSSSSGGGSSSPSSGGGSLVVTDSNNYESLEDNETSIIEEIVDEILGGNLSGSVNPETEIPMRNVRSSILLMILTIFVFVIFWISFYIIHKRKERGNLRIDQGELKREIVSRPVKNNLVSSKPFKKLS